MKITDCYRIYAGRFTYRLLIFCAAASVGLIAAAGLVNRFSDIEWLRGFALGFGLTVAEVNLGVTGVMCESLVFNANLRSQPGYGYFRALPNSAESFTKALAFANVLGVGMTALEAAAALIFVSAETVLLIMFIGLFSLGWINFFGASRKSLIRIVPLFAVGFAFGFMGAFYDDEPVPVSYLIVSAVFAAAALIFYIASAAYISANSAKIRERED